MGNKLQFLTLIGFAKIDDGVFANVVPSLPRLTALVLRYPLKFHMLCFILKLLPSGCTKVGDKTAESLAKHCHGLQLLNLNYTSVTPGPISNIIICCPDLGTLKVAGISTWVRFPHHENKLDPFIWIPFHRTMPNLKGLHHR